MIVLVTRAPPTNWTIMYNQDFGEKPQSSLIPPPVTPREDTQHIMEIPVQANNAPNMDPSDWDITCTEFHPRKRRPARKTQRRRNPTNTSSRHGASEEET